MSGVRCEVVSSSQGGLFGRGTVRLHVKEMLIPSESIIRRRKCFSPSEVTFLDECSRYSVFTSISSQIVLFERFGMPCPLPWTTEGRESQKDWLHIGLLPDRFCR